MRPLDQARMGLAYAASLVSFAAGGPPRPFSATFNVTNRCNLRCSYCNFPFLDPRELSLDRLELLFDRLRELGVQRLGLSGGEPLMRKDIGAIVRLAKARKFTVSLNSNLMLYSRFRDTFEQVDVAFTSLDGPPAAHRTNRGANAWDGVLDAISDLVARQKRVVAICVVNEHSLDHASELLRLVEELSIQIHFQTLCTDTAMSRGGLSRSVTNACMRSFFDWLLREKRAGRPIVSSTRYLEFLSRWEDFFVSSYYDAAERCAAGRGFLYVDPQGNAYPCAFTQDRTAPVNLLTEDWRKAWSGETPCTRCSVGPMLEFNLLFRSPLGAASEALRSYG